MGKILIDFFQSNNVLGALIQCRKLSVVSIIESVVQHVNKVMNLTEHFMPTSGTFDTLRYGHISGSTTESFRFNTQLNLLLSACSGFQNM